MEHIECHHECDENGRCVRCGTLFARICCPGPESESWTECWGHMHFPGELIADQR